MYRHTDMWQQQLCQVSETLKEKFRLFTIINNNLLIFLCEKKTIRHTDGYYLNIQGSLI